MIEHGKSAANFYHCEDFDDFIHAMLDTVHGDQDLLEQHFIESPIRVWERSDVPDGEFPPLSQYKPEDLKTDVPERYPVIAFGWYANDDPAFKAVVFKWTYTDRKARLSLAKRLLQHYEDLSDRTK